MSEHVDLDLPLHPRHAATIRAVTASLAADAGFSVDEIDDLRLGVNEAVSVLTDVDAGPDARLHVRVDPGPGSVTVTSARRGVAEQVVSADLDDLAGRILRAVVDEFGIDDAGAFTVVKRTAPPE
jgi:anti-sigma regulatory factor (Ser/Thr protein kinase)